MDENHQPGVTRLPLGSTEPRPDYPAIRSFLADSQSLVAPAIVPALIDGRAWWPLPAIVRAFRLNRKSRLVANDLPEEHRRIVPVGSLPLRTRITAFNGVDRVRLSRDPNLTVVDEQALRYLARGRTEEARLYRAQILADLLRKVAVAVPATVPATVPTTDAGANGRPHPPDPDRDLGDDVATIPSWEIDGQRWWLIRDACRLLCLQNGAVAASRRLLDHHKRFHPVIAPDGPGSLLVNRAGLRKLADTGHRAGIKEFRRGQIDRLLACLPTGEPPRPAADRPSDPDSRTVLDAVSIVFPNPDGGVCRPTAENPPRA